MRWLYLHFAGVVLLGRGAQPNSFGPRSGLDFPLWPRLILRDFPTPCCLSSCDDSAATLTIDRWSAARLCAARARVTVGIVCESGPLRASSMDLCSGTDRAHLQSFSDRRRPAAGARAVVHCLRKEAAHPTCVSEMKETSFNATILDAANRNTRSRFQPLSRALT